MEQLKRLKAERLQRALKARQEAMGGDPISAYLVLEAAAREGLPTIGSIRDRAYDRLSAVYGAERASRIRILVHRAVRDMDDVQTADFERQLGDVVGEAALAA
ncbi:hypothetical protein JN531_016760 (plasmid) [Flagellatimonas centrodinii]|uniref:hypothetical protein n=1 Tax=Flagellatimonas centrodinii TaxID=2806210 RepID=UPI001FED8509|nr:hypothetical protein [Flagellatimonas centrodinii]ULQ48429.1 hypothetical protein JN531_016760 [Flagellatimonas centrodinii]